MSQAEATSLAATIALFGAILGVLAGLIATEINRRQRAHELFYKSLEFLAGGTQNRNLGVAAIELYGRSGRRRTVARSLLVGSAIYLLEGSEQGSKAHERYNLDRIMGLLLDTRRVTKDLIPRYSALLDVVQRKRAGDFSSGLPVSDDALWAWEVALSGLLSDQKVSPV